MPAMDGSGSGSGSKLVEPVTLRGTQAYRDMTVQSRVARSTLYSRLIYQKRNVVIHNYNT